MENEITDAELDAIDARADAASEGPWTINGDGITFGYTVRGPDNPYYHNGHPNKAHCQWENDAEHIAGMDPPTTKRLTAALRAARKRIAELEGK